MDQTNLQLVNPKTSNSKLTAADEDQTVDEKESIRIKDCHIFIDEIPVIKEHEFIEFTPEGKLNKC